MHYFLWSKMKPRCHQFQPKYSRVHLVTSVLSMIALRKALLFSHPEMMIIVVAKELVRGGVYLGFLSVFSCFFSNVILVSVEFLFVFLIYSHFLFLWCWLVSWFVGLFFFAKFAIEKNLLCFQLIIESNFNTRKSSY